MQHSVFYSGEKSAAETICIINSDKLQMLPKDFNVSWQISLLSTFSERYPSVQLQIFLLVFFFVFILFSTTDPNWI